MKDRMFVIGRIISLLVFILAFSLMGLVSGKPIMILAYAGFFIALMLVIFLSVRKHQRHFEIVSQQSRTMSKIIGIVMVLAAIGLPVVSLANLQIFEMAGDGIGMGFLALVLGVTVIMIAGGVFAVSLINKANGKIVLKVIGYLLLAVLSAIPALMVMPHDQTTTGIGSIYYITILVAVLSWWGLNLYLNKE